MSDFPSLVSLPVPTGPSATAEKGEPTVLTVEATTCKIRGPFTNQPSKLGEDTYGRIDWILSNWKGGTWEYAPKFNVEITTSNDRTQPFISDYSTLRPYWNDKSSQVGIADWTAESTSDHVPVIATCTYGKKTSNQTIKVFQMNLLANGLCGDGFVKPISRSDTETVREPLVIMMKITTRLLNLLLTQNPSEGKPTTSLSTVARIWTTNKYPRETVQEALDQLFLLRKVITDPKAAGALSFLEESDSDLTIWENFRDALLASFPLEVPQLIRDASIKDIDRKMVFERARVLSKSILNSNPDVLTLQENDMMYLLCDNNMCPNFDRMYTCLVDQDSGTTKQAYDAALMKDGEGTAIRGTMNGDENVAGLLKKTDSVPNGMVGFQQKLKGEPTADRVEVHKDGVFVYVRKGDFKILSVTKSFIGTNYDVPVVAALVERRAPSSALPQAETPPQQRFCVISTHLSSGDNPKMRMKEMGDLKLFIDTLPDEIPILLGMDANCNVEEIAGIDGEGNPNHAKQLLESLPVVK